MVCCKNRSIRHRSCRDSNKNEQQQSIPFSRSVLGALDRLLALPSEDAITKAAADLKLAEVDLAKAQAAYDKIAYSDAIGANPKTAELQKATLTYQHTLTIFNKTNNLLFSLTKNKQ